MTWKWLMLIVLALLAAMWIVYGAMHALNGILYEARLMRAQMGESDAEA